MNCVHQIAKWNTSPTIRRLMALLCYLADRRGIVLTRPVDLSNELELPVPTIVEALEYLESRQILSRQETEVCGLAYLVVRIAEARLIEVITEG